MLNPNPRINISSDVTVLDSLVLLSEGNPGAATVLIKLGELLVDDQAAYGRLLLRLDDLSIYGPAIWIGYRDICNQDLQAFITKAHHEPSFADDIKELM